MTTTYSPTGAFGRFQSSQNESKPKSTIPDRIVVNNPNALYTASCAVFSDLDPQKLTLRVTQRP